MNTYKLLKIIALSIFLFKCTDPGDNNNLILNESVKNDIDKIGLNLSIEQQEKMNALDNLIIKYDADRLIINENTIESVLNIDMQEFEGFLIDVQKAKKYTDLANTRGEELGKDLEVAESREEEITLMQEYKSDLQMYKNEIYGEIKDNE